MFRIGIILAAAIFLLGCGSSQHLPLASPVSVMTKKKVPVALKLPDGFQGEVSIDPFGMQATTDSGGWIKVDLPDKPRQVVIKKGDKSLPLDTRTWMIPYRYVVENDGSVQRQWPWVEFRRLPADTTSRAQYSVLCKSEYPAQAFINGEEVKMYQTGIFFKEVKFVEGLNTIRAKVIGKDSKVAVYERDIFYKKPDISQQAIVYQIDSTSVKPSVNQILLPEDKLRIGFKGTGGQKAYALVNPGKMKVPLLRKDFSGYSLYEADFSLHHLKKGKAYDITFVLEPGDGIAKNKPVKLLLPSKIMIQDLADFPLVETVEDNTVMTYNLGPIRLGGPIIAEYGPGVVLKVNGKVGDYYRIYLNRNEMGMLHSDNVKLLPKDWTKPSYFIQYAGVALSGDTDIVNIPYSEPVPYAVYPEPDQKRIRIALYGVKTSSTWLSHRQGLKIIDKVTWQQTTPETYELIVNLKTDKIWGYELIKEGTTLQLRLKHPPKLQRDEKGRMIKGLKVAIEAGHGAHNTGATGLSGLLEKDVNLDVSLQLEKICRENGVAVVQVREIDKYMRLSEKRDIIEASDAHLHVSIHANSASSRGNYLRVGGASTYYHNPFWADFAKIMYGDLLELPLDEFGVVGSFNYLVTRISSRPAILVEQAFMSHAEDEEKLASPEFRRQMAEKIFEGIVDYVGFMGE